MQSMNPKVDEMFKGFYLFSKGTERTEGKSG